MPMSRSTATRLSATDHATFDREHTRQTIASYTISIHTSLRRRSGNVTGES
jgi:hypothetical protein